MAENEIKFVPDSASLEKAQERIVAGQEKHTKAIEGTAKASREAAAEERKNKADVAKITKDLETAQDRANRKIAEATEHYKAGRISLETLNRVIEKQNALVVQAIQREREQTAEYKERKAAIEAAIAAKEKELAAAKKSAAQEEQHKKNVAARLQLEKIRASEQEAINAKEAAASEAQHQKNIASILKVRQIRDAETAAVLKRQESETAAQKQKNVEALKLIHQIRESEQAAIDARKKQQNDELTKQKELKKAEEERGKAAKKVYDDTRTPAEQYAIRLNELKGLLKEGKISQEEYARAVKMAKQEMLDAGKSGGAYSSTLSKIAGYLSVGGLLMKGLSMWKDSHREIIEQATEIAKKYDEIIRKWNIQAGLRGMDSDKSIDQISEIANQSAVPFDQAAAVATQLVSSGFDAKDSSSGALKAVLDVLNASALRGKNLNPDELVKSLSMYLTSQKLELNAENVRKVGTSVQLLSKPTNLNMTQLQNLSENAGPMADLVPWEQQLAIYGTLVNQMPAANAATGMRNFVTRLSGASQNKSRAKILKKLGVNPEDVDFVGEDIFEVAERMEKALAAAPEKDRIGLQNELIGEQAAPAMSAIIKHRDAIRQNLELMKNDKEFEGDVQEATTGRRAAEVRLTNMQERVAKERDQLDDLFKKELGLQLQEKGFSPFVVMKQGKAFDSARTMGLSTESALKFALPFDSALLGQEHGITPESIREGVNDVSGNNIAPSFEALQGKEAESVRVLKDLRDELRQWNKQNQAEAEKNRQQNQKNADRQVKAFENNRPQKPSPLDKHNRGNR